MTDRLNLLEVLFIVAMCAIGASDWLSPGGMTGALIAGVPLTLAIWFTKRWAAKTAAAR